MMTGRDTDMPVLVTGRDQYQKARATKEGQFQVRVQASRSATSAVSNLGGRDTR